MPEIRRKGVLAAAGVSLAVLCVAAALRLHRGGRGELFAASRGTDYGLAFVASDGSPLSEHRGRLRLRLDPFTLFSNVPHQRTASFTIDGDGFRGGAAGDRPPVMLLGGSVAFGHGARSDAETISGLANAAGAAFEVVNAAVVGFCSGQELAQMVHRRPRRDPVAFVVLDGWNDYFAEDAGPRRREGEFGFANWFFEIEDRLRLMAAARDGRRPEGRSEASWPDDEAYLRALSASYTENLLGMAAFARGRGARFLVLFQPEIGCRSGRTAAEDAILRGADDGFGWVRAGLSRRYGAMIASASAACLAAGVRCVDLSADPRFTGPSEPLFADLVHLTAAGNAVVARILLDELGALLR